MVRWDYTHLKEQSIAVSLLWVFAFCLVFYKLVTSKNLMQFLICCLMFIAVIIMLGFLILWWGNRPD